MLIKQVIELIDILDSPSASGAAVEQYLRAIDPQAAADTAAVAAEVLAAAVEARRCRFFSRERMPERR